MTTRTASFALFFACAVALVLLLVLDRWGTSSTDGGRTPAGGIAGPSPAGGAVAAGPPAGAPAPEAGRGAESPHDPEHPPDPLIDLPLTDEEQARGVKLVPGGGRVDFKNKVLSLPAVVCQQNVPIELFACAEGGKDHESVLRVRCRPELVNLNLTLFGLKKGPSHPPAGGEPGDRVVVLCEWTQAGRPVSVRAEEMIWNESERAPMDRVGWTYIGSKFVPDYDVETGKQTKGRYFGATLSRTLMATFKDDSALLETPLPESVDDTSFVANNKVIPARGTPVRVVLRPPTPEEREEMRRVEQRIDARRKAHPPKGMNRDEASKNQAPPPDGKQ